LILLRGDPNRRSAISESVSSDVNGLRRHFRAVQVAEPRSFRRARPDAAVDFAGKCVLGCDEAENQ
jgi:hypothetical protein